MPYVLTLAPSVSTSKYFINIYFASLFGGVSVCSCFKLMISVSIPLYFCSFIVISFFHVLPLTWFDRLLIRISFTLFRHFTVNSILYTLSQSPKHFYLFVNKRGEKKTFGKYLLYAKKVFKFFVRFVRWLSVYNTLWCVQCSCLCFGPFGNRIREKNWKPLEIRRNRALVHTIYRFGRFSA